MPDFNITLKGNAIWTKKVSAQVIKLVQYFNFNLKVKLSRLMQKKEKKKIIAIYGN